MQSNRFDTGCQRYHQLLVVYDVLLSRQRRAALCRHAVLAATLAALAHCCVPLPKQRCCQPSLATGRHHTSMEHALPGTAASAVDAVLCLVLVTTLTAAGVSAARPMQGVKCLRQSSLSALSSKVRRSMHVAAGCCKRFRPSVTGWQPAQPQHMSASSTHACQGTMLSWSCLQYLPAGCVRG